VDLAQGFGETKAPLSYNLACMLELALETLRRR